MLLPLLLACAGPGVGGRPPSDKASYAAPSCEETAREEIAPDALPDGFTRTPQEVLDVATGRWAGWFDGDFTDAGLLTDAAVEVAGAGAPIERVEEVEVSFGEDGEARAPSPSCPLRWEVPLVVTVDAHEGALDEVFPVTFSATSLAALPEDARFRGSVPAAAVRGTAEQPPFDPAEWDEIALVLDGLLADPGAGLVFSGSVDWVATRAYDRETATDTEDELHLGGFLVEPEE